MARERDWRATADDPDDEVWTCPHCGNDCKADCVGDKCPACGADLSEDD